MATEAEKVIAGPQDQAPTVPETSTNQATMSLEEKSGETAPIVPVGTESSKPAEPPIEASSATTETIPVTTEAKDVTDIANEDSKTAPAEPASATTELTNESGGNPQQTVDTTKTSVDKPLDDAVKEPVEKPTDEPVTAPSAPVTATTNGDTKLDAQAKDVTDQIVIGDARTKKATARNGKRKAENAFDTNDESDRKKSKIDTAQSIATDATVLIKKVGRPKKDRKILTPIGRTARKTRSQGPVEV
ncbi:hypothetical protein QBC38DRAFT_192602 [Podospora fimiseda]|uniref:Uncharacterized protein n=1 Tax=Podospora fimiseda TaxID=252190 RepID=A0AAN7BQ61_9PEZI|nr:hypothetical protein QBC38DRAFT_192602 [Podospora fimiseda]